MKTRLLRTLPLCLAIPVIAQASEPVPAALEICIATADNAARLACFDRWAAQQPTLSSVQVTAGQVPSDPAGQVPAPLASATPLSVAAPSAEPGADNGPQASANTGCRDAHYSELSRFWELEEATDCGTFRLRGYRPVSLALVASDSVNRQPSSTAPGRTPDQPVAYRNTETRMQLSVRTKLATGLLTHFQPDIKDSLWFGYTQQSYWQLFTGDLSRPFRNTDHEPEVVYVYPLTADLPLGWKWRYAGVAYAHQSNGQTLPLSRSWNRFYVMAGAELGHRWTAQVRLWERAYGDTRDDDNPHIESYIGRAEFRLNWNVNDLHTLGLTLRHSLSTGGHGSARLEWFRVLGEPSGSNKSNLRLHAQLFNGYGDSLVDFNRQRMVFTLGLSLLDF